MAKMHRWSNSRKRAHIKKVALREAELIVRGVNALQQKGDPRISGKVKDIGQNRDEIVVKLAEVIAQNINRFRPHGSWSAFK
jgi:hypothetical protein